VDLSNACAVISGGASGLGRAVATRVISAGGKACLLDINADQGAATAAELGDHAMFVQTDVTDEKAVEAGVAAGLERMGRISLAVSCAGVIGAGRVLGRDGPMPGEQFARTIAINLLGTFYLVKESAAAMENNEPESSGERGVIVNTASVAAFEGQIGQVAYSASKGAVVGMTLPVARELARIGVRVMTVAPGIFETPMMASVTEEFRHSLEVQVPFPSRLGRADEYADLVAHIYQNEMLNGTTIRLDGAIRMQPK